MVLLDTDLEENSEWDRTLTHYLYGGDQHYRLCQEVVLGIGGMRMLQALGYNSIEKYHMNEGHASLLTTVLLNEEVKKGAVIKVTHAACEAVRKQCIFTTHTPVPAGHDHFPMDLVSWVLGNHNGFIDMTDVFCIDLVNRILESETGHGFENPEQLASHGMALNMIYIALNLSHYINGVAKKHGEISRHMFGDYTIDSITNGVYAATWACSHFQKLFDRHIPGWKEDNFSLRYALSLSGEDIWEAHTAAKNELIEIVNRLTNCGLDTNLLALGFARRMAAYKRPDIFFDDITRIKQIVSKAGPFQIIYAGKAHPQDQGGKDLIKHIFELKEALKDDLKIVYLENYDMMFGKLMTAGVDVWLNTPERPFEASGTSGMKAALNGVPSLSVLDGWWCEACIEGVTGWATGGEGQGIDKKDNRSQDAASLYRKLEENVIPLFYKNRTQFVDIMRHAIALNGSFFNTQRMLQQYIVKAYFE